MSGGGEFTSVITLMYVYITLDVGHREVKLLGGFFGEEQGLEAVEVNQGPSRLRSPPMRAGSNAFSTLPLARSLMVEFTANDRSAIFSLPEVPEISAVAYRPARGEVLQNTG